MAEDEWTLLKKLVDLFWCRLLAEQDEQMLLKRLLDLVWRHLLAVQTTKSRHTLSTYARLTVRTHLQEELQRCARQLLGP